jgi:hypothetical protein
MKNFESDLQEADTVSDSVICAPDGTPDDVSPVITPRMIFYFMSVMNMYTSDMTLMAKMIRKSKSV